MDDRTDWVKDLVTGDDLGWARGLAVGEPLKELDWDVDLEDPQSVLHDALMSAAKYMDRKASTWERVAGYLREENLMDPADAHHLRHIRKEGLSDPADAADRMARVCIEARQLISDLAAKVRINADSETAG